MENSNQHWVVLDAGRSLIKAKNGSGEMSFTHAVLRLNETDYRAAVSRGGSIDLMRINGIPYAFGETAIKNGYQSRQVAADRYNELYYGAIVAATLYRLYEKPIRNVLLYASHAPVDVDYRADIIAAAKSVWEVESGDTKRVYTVTNVRCFDEPVGGVMNMLLNSNGTHYQRSDIRNGNTLVFDVGGQTIDIAALDKGKVDYTSITSRVGGIIAVEETFKRLFRSEHKAKLKSTPYLNPKRVREAIRTGVYDAGALGKIDCSAQLQESVSPVLTRIKDLISEFGDISNYDNMVFTGGGGGLLFNHIKDFMNHNAIRANIGRDYFHLADEPDNVHLANVRGGWRLLKAFEAKGAI